MYSVYTVLVQVHKYQQFLHALCDAFYDFVYYLYRECEKW